MRHTTLSMLALGTLLGAQAAPVIPAASQCRLLVVVMPKDEWRLTIERDGSSRINYAALPQAATAAPGTFHFAEVHSQLKVRAQPSCSGDVSGTVEFVKATREEATPWCLPDEPYAAALFERAWDAVGQPADAVEREHVELLRSMWGRRKAPKSRP